jgi:excisionase family DNA binding protein
MGLYRTALYSSTVNGRKSMVATQIQTRQLLYAIPDAGRMVGLSRSTMYILIAKGEIEVVPFGRRRLVTDEAIVSLAKRIESGEVTL